MRPLIDTDYQLDQLISRGQGQMPQRYSTTWAVISYLINNIQGFRWLRKPTELNDRNTKRVNECVEMLKIVLDDEGWFNHHRILDDVHIKHMLDFNKCPLYYPLNPVETKRLDYAYETAKIGKIPV